LNRNLEARHLFLRIHYVQRLILSALSVLLPAWLLYASEPEIPRETVLKAIDEVYSLNHEEARKRFDGLRETHPESPVVQGMLAFIAYNRLLYDTRNLAVFRYGMPSPSEKIHPPEDQVEQKEPPFLKENKALLDLCEKRLRENPGDPNALYFKGMAYENLAMYTITLYGDKLEAARYATTAARFHKEVLKIDPAFVDATTSTAVPEYIAGSLPFGIRWLSLFVGIRGDKEGAMVKLREVAEKGTYRAADSLLVMALLNAWKGDPGISVTLFRRLREMYRSNFILDVSLAAVYADCLDDPASAIGIYNELLEDLPQKAPGIHPGEIHFRIGENYMKLKEFPRALDQFEKALHSSRGSRETEPLTYYNMALVYEKLGNRERALECYRSAAAYAGPAALIEEELDKSRKKAK
jgi:tetratricopeptide (TPR) repeat protein